MLAISNRLEHYVNANACVCMIGMVLECCIAFWLLYLPQWGPCKFKPSYRY